MIKIATIVGARPQFVKAATVSRAIKQYNLNRGEKGGIKETIIHTGQHYDENMSQIFFEELEIPMPDYNLSIGSFSHGKQTGRMLEAIEKVLIEENPDIVLTYGDTNSTLAGALAAVKLHIPTAHVEAGLRSYNRKMPEEINRIITDEISNLLFCPTKTAVENLRSEGISPNQRDKDQHLDQNQQFVFNVGDVMVDSLLFNMDLAQNKSNILKKLGLLKKRSERKNPDHKIEDMTDYCLATLHRPENTDDKTNLSNILHSLMQIASERMMVLLPLHPRTRQCIQDSGLAKRLKLRIPGDTSYPFVEDNKAVKDRPILILPVSYLDMIQLERHAKAVFTDSGGIQKEAFLLKVPCITLRNETEWLETVQAGWNILTGADSGKIGHAFNRTSEWNGIGSPFSSKSLEKAGEPPEAEPLSPYGDGHSAERIVSTLLKVLNHQNSIGLPS